MKASLELQGTRFASRFEDLLGVEWPTITCVGLINMLCSDRPASYGGKWGRVLSGELVAGALMPGDVVVWPRRDNANLPMHVGIIIVPEELIVLHCGYQNDDDKNDKASVSIIEARSIRSRKFCGVPMSFRRFK